jgi:hypothetical protein
MSLSTRQLYFISGNPHYGHIRKGVIEFDEDIRLDSALTLLDQYDDRHKISGSSSPCPPPPHALQCILSVPAFMIHEVELLSPSLNPLISLSHSLSLSCPFRKF